MEIKKIHAREVLDSRGNPTHLLNFQNNTEIKDFLCCKPSLQQLKIKKLDQNNQVGFLRNPTERRLI